jgi:hypothetical protein
MRRQAAFTHAPGPWHIEPLQADQGGSIAICNRQQGILAVIPPLNDDDEPDEATAQRDPHDQANARLIAAAPKLLEALRELLEHVEWRRRRVGEVAGPNDCTHRAHAAIAEATGKEGAGQ